jgi:predicted acylesterase/phospholipase RssA
MRRRVMDGHAIDPGERLRHPETYTGKKLNCDVVMKGGITSGVTYPWAVCEIAATYKLNSVGGSSAGAIAAATAAAAELGRANAPDRADAGFPRLAKLPDRLAEPPPGSKDSTLFSLFQPQKATEPFYRVLVASIKTKGKGKIPKILFALFRWFGLWAIVGALPGLAVVGLSLTVLYQHPALRTSPRVVAVFILIVLVGLVATAVGALAGTLANATIRGLKHVPRNGFGLCSGFARTPDPASEEPCGDPLARRALAVSDAPKPLTTWLADELDALAGKPTNGCPVTLGELSACGIELKMFTTNLTDGTPYTLPFKPVDHFYFDESQFRKLFPGRVVDWLRDRAAPADANLPQAPPIDGRPAVLRRLPPCEDFPVVLAARMSLSFPILLSTIPLWAIETRRGEETTREWVQCRFSDGGITSNFPIHFFDGPIPRWPTFGLNIGPFDPGDRPDPDDQSKNIWFPTDNRGGIVPRYRQIEKVPEFIQAILDTMENWSDNGQTRLPGYRDRIILIKHTKDEGGLNLNMPKARIVAFSERGRWAGQRLVERFSENESQIRDDQLSWDVHRWTRYRSFMDLLEKALERYRRAYLPSPAGTWPTYANLIESPPALATDTDWVDPLQRQVAKDLTEKLLTLTDTWLQLGSNVPSPDPPPQCKPRNVTGFDRDHPFQAHAPLPRPALRVAPDF